MTNKVFREWLQQFPDNAEVLSWDPDEQEWYPVTGATYDAQEIKLYTDDVDC